MELSRATSAKLECSTDIHHTQHWVHCHVFDHIDIITAPKHHPHRIEAHRGDLHLSSTPPLQVLLRLGRTFDEGSLCTE
jgi:hypothetical protein